MAEVDEACSGVAALLRLDPKNSAESTTSLHHSIQVAVRRLLILAPSSDQQATTNSGELARRQLAMLSRVLRHFGPAPLRSLRLLIAELIFRCICSPSCRTRKLSASLHRWFLVLFGAECVQQRSEFLAVGLARLACHQLGIDYQPADGQGTEQEGGSGSSYDALYLANKTAITDSETRLAEQLALVSPVDLFACYCDALVNLLSPISESSSSSSAPPLSVDLYLPSILAIFDTLSDAFSKIRSSRSQMSAADQSRVRGVVVPFFDLVSAVSQASFRRQLLPAARRIQKPILLAPLGIFDPGEHEIFVAWARAYRSNIEAFGFRMFDENLTKSTLDFALKTLRNALNTKSQTFSPCQVISNSVGIFSAILSCSVPAQRSSGVDGVISSALQVVVSSVPNRYCHVCEKCCKSVCRFLSAGILSPPFTSGGMPCSQPTIANILSALSSNTKNTNFSVEVSQEFSAALSACLGAAARFAPSMTFSSPISPSNPPPAASMSSDRLPLYTVPAFVPVPTSTSSVVLNEEPSPLQSPTGSRRRLRSANNKMASPSLSLTNNNNVKSPQAAKRVKTGSDDAVDDDVVIVNPDDSSDVIVVEDEASSKKAVANEEETAGIDSLFSTFVAAPPDEAANVL